LASLDIKSEGRYLKGQTETDRQTDRQTDNLIRNFHLSFQIRYALCTFAYGQRDYEESHL